MVEVDITRLFRILIWLILGILVIVPVIISLLREDEDVHPDGFFRMYSILDLSRDKFAERFLRPLYLIPIVFVVLIVLIDTNFDIVQVTALLAVVTVATLIIGATSSLQATFIERDSAVDILMYYTIVLYLSIFLIPDDIILRIIPIRVTFLNEPGFEFYIPILLAVTMLFFATLFLFFMFVMKTRLEAGRVQIDL